VETCPHCNFLVREGAATCGVCHRPVHAESGAPAYLAGDRRASEVVSARIGPEETGPSIGLFLLFAILVLMAVAAVVVSRMW